MASPPPAAAALVPQDCNNGCSAEGTGEGGSKEPVETFKAEDLIITRATILKEKPDPSTLVFGTVFTDHMLTVEWSLELGWEKPRIKPLQNLSLHPGSSALHYAVELFEGLKAFRGVDNKIRLFRPNLNMDRMYRSAMRATLPGEFKVSERYLTMDDLTTAVEENRTIHIPTMENGPKLASRILEKLTDIQYGREESDWTITVA
ncbi:hypothetical protein JEQ12_014865 [Ovis aries]|uniref:Uncharacterized protein n=1 Tax=Ovis aries TaxID=9940 RepID=A0A836D4A2_SHEEP|nr:hypothetical protein JEQ12_014865 [Ovis aries]